MPALLHPSAWNVKSCSLSWLSHSLSLPTTLLLLHSCLGLMGGKSVLTFQLCLSGMLVLLARVENPISSCIVLQQIPASDKQSSLQKFFCKALPTACSGVHVPHTCWEVRPTTGMLCVKPTQTKGMLYSSGEEDLTLRRHYAKDWLWCGRRTVWLLICVPLIQRMKTFPLMRAMVKPTAYCTPPKQPSFKRC